MAVVMIPMHIRFVVCGELTIPHLGLIYYCFYKRKIAMRNLGRPSRSDFVQLEQNSPELLKTHFVDFAYPANLLVIPLPMPSVLAYFSNMQIGSY